MTARVDTKLWFQFLTLTLLYTHDVQLRHAGALSQCNSQIDVIALYTVGGDAHILEKAVAPIALDGIGNLITGNGYHIANGEARDTYNHRWFKVVGTRKVNATDGVFVGCTGI